MERADDQKSEEPSRRRNPAWLLLLALALAEVVGHFVLQARVVGDDDWHRAAARVRAEWQPGDVIVPAPSWTDPIVRRELGDLISLADAGRADDLSRFRRLWVLSARGHRPTEAPDAAPELDEQLGPIRVLRWDLPHDPVLYDFSEHVRDARATIELDGREEPCRWQRTGRPRGGGLGAGPMEPAERHFCDPRRRWLWVGTTMQDDLNLRPRWCIFQHPSGSEPLRVTFPNVPLGERLILGGSLYYEHERNLEHGPVEVAVFVDGEAVGRMTHRDGDGYKEMEAATQPAGEAHERGDVSVVVTAADPTLRTFCWNATTRGARP